jgi:hypothetical protein
VLIAYPVRRAWGANCNTLLVGFCEFIGLIASPVLATTVCTLRLGCRCSYTTSQIREWAMKPGAQYSLIVMECLAAYENS